MDNILITNPKRKWYKKKRYISLILLFILAIYLFIKNIPVMFHPPLTDYERAYNYYISEEDRSKKLFSAYSKWDCEFKEDKGRIYVIKNHSYKDWIYFSNHVYFGWGIGGGDSFLCRNKNTTSNPLETWTIKEIEFYEKENSIYLDSSLFNLVKNDILNGNLIDLGDYNSIGMEISFNETDIVKYRCTIFKTNNNYYYRMTISFDNYKFIMVSDEIAKILIDNGL